MPKNVVSIDDFLEQRELFMLEDALNIAPVYADKISQLIEDSNVSSYCAIIALAIAMRHCAMGVDDELKRAGYSDISIVNEDIQNALEIASTFFSHRHKSVS